MPSSMPSGGSEPFKTVSATPAHISKDFSFSKNIAIAAVIIIVIGVTAVKNFELPEISPELDVKPTINVETPEFVGGLGDTIGDTASSVKDAVTNAATTSVATVKSAPEKAKEAVVKVAKKVVEPVKKVVEPVKKVVEPVKKVVEPVKKAVSAPVKKVASVIKKIKIGW